MQAQGKVGSGSDQGPQISAATTDGAPGHEAPAADPEAIAHIIKIVSQARVIRSGTKSIQEEAAKPQQLGESRDTAGKPSADLLSKTQGEEQTNSPKKPSRWARRNASPSKNRSGSGSRVNNEREEVDGETIDRWVADSKIKIHTTESREPVAKNPGAPEPLMVEEALPAEPVLVPDPGVDPHLDPDLQEVKNQLRQFYLDMKVENKRLRDLLAVPKEVVTKVVVDTSLQEEMQVNLDTATTYISELESKYYTI